MHMLETFMISSEELSCDFFMFKKEAGMNSETFQYWDHFLDQVQQLRNLVRADREGDWLLHVCTVNEILPYFAVFDCINYLRWGSVYLEDMNMLPKEHMENSIPLQPIRVLNRR